MDNEAIVDQIVRSLSFEVIAVPQNAYRSDSSSQLTPVNVKIRVRKKNDSGLRHGVLSMPKVDQKEKNPERPERIRLVSSDQTIMSFNVVMEGEFEHVSPKQRQQNLNMVVPGSEVYNNDEDYLSLSNNNTTPAPIFLKRNKDIFGTCKPGGCLDPPFGEEKYSYQPAKVNMSLSAKADTAKLKTSSIFKNSLFKRRKKSTQDSHSSENKTKTTEAESILSLYESGSQTQQIPISPTTYSNSIITYPHISNSSQVRLPDENLIKKRYSSEDKSRSSMSEGNGSYFVISKKAKNLSKESDPLKVFENNVETRIKNTEQIIKKKESVHIRSLSPASVTDESLKVHKSRTDEEHYSSKLHSYVPIPLLNVINDNEIGKVSPEGNNYDELMLQALHDQSKHLNDNFGEAPEINLDTIKDSIKEGESPVIQQLNFISESNSTCSVALRSKKVNEDAELNTSPNEIFNFIDDNNMTTINNLQQEKLSDHQINKYNHIPNKLTSSSYQVEKSSFQVIQNEHTDLRCVPDPGVEINQEQHSSSKIIENAIRLTAPSEDNLLESHKKYLDTCLQDQENRLSGDFDKYIDKSHPLVPTKEREKSILDITASTILSVQNVVYSTEDLKHIWINETEPLKSVADVITALSSKKSSENLLSARKESSTSNVNDNCPVFKVGTSKENVKLEPLMQDNKISDICLNAEDIKYDQVAPEGTQINIVMLDSTITLVSQSEIYKNVSEPQYTTITKLTNDVEELFLNDVNDDNAHELEKSLIIDDKLTSNSDSIVAKGLSNKLEDDKNYPESKNIVELPEKDYNILQEHLDSVDKIEPSEKSSILESRSRTVKSLTKSNISENNKIVSDAKNAKESSEYTGFVQEPLGSIDKIDFSEKISVEPILFGDDVAMNVELSEKSSKLDVCDANLKQTVKDYADSIKLGPNESYIKSTLTGFSEHENIGTDVIEQNNVDSTSDPLSLEIENVYYGTLKLSDQNNENLQNGTLLNLSSSKGDIGLLNTKVEANKLTVEQLSLELHELEPEQQTKEVLSSYSVDEKSPQLATILRKQASWKIDFALQSYLNENNERIIKSYNSGNLPERRKNDAVLVVQCDIGSESNEIKIPIDCENNLCIKIKNNRTRSRSTVILSEKSDVYDKKKIEVDIKVSEPSVENIYNEDINKAEADTHNKVFTNDIRDVLITVYEQELLPLQDIIKGLREEIDMMAAYQVTFRERAQKLTPKRSRLLRLVGNKKCGCVRKK